MKYTVFFCITILSVSLFSQSLEKPEQEADSKIAIAVKAYEICLTHENEGVVESAIANVLMFKQAYPEADMESIEILLDELSETSNSTKIQTRASLVSQIMRNPKLISRIKEKFFQDVESFFEILAIGTSLHQIDEYLLSENVSEIDHPVY